MQVMHEDHTHHEEGVLLLWAFFPLPLDVVRELLQCSMLWLILVLSLFNKLLVKLYINTLDNQKTRY